MNQRLEKLLKSHNFLNEKNELVVSDYKKFMSLLSAEFDQQDQSVISTMQELEKLRVVLDTNPCTISWVSSDLTYGGVNQTLADVCGVAASEFTGKTIGCYSKDNYFFNFAKRLFAQSEKDLTEELVSSINTSERIFWVMGTKFDQGRQAVIIGVDMTEVHHLQDTVAFMDKLSSLGEMVAGIVHEVNNPLAAIKANAQLIERNLQMNNIEKATEISKKMDATVDRISSIILGIKSFVRRGDMDPREDVAIGKIIDEAHLICEGKFKQKTVDYFGSQDNGDLVIHCNYTEIFQVFVNLMANAIDAIEKLPERWVKIEIKKLGDDKMQIYFIDSGKGLPENVKKNLFKTFYTTKEKGKGTGLGLSLCKKIIESHGGTIDVDDKQPNTTFVITLNLAGVKVQ